MSEYCIEVKFLKNRQIDLMNGSNIQPPFKNELTLINGSETYIPNFDLTKVHKIELLDENPREIEREQGMSDRLYTELVDESFREAMENRKKNKAIRARLEDFVKSGTLQIVNDPFDRTQKGDEKPAKSDEKPVKSGRGRNE